MNQHQLLYLFWQAGPICFQLESSHRFMDKLCAQPLGRTGQFHLNQEIKLNEGMEDGFYVIGFRKVTNKYFVSLSLLPLTSHFPNFPVASLLSFFVYHLYLFSVLSTPVCPHLSLVCHHCPTPLLLLLSTFLPHRTPGFAPLPPLQPYYTNRASLTPSSGPRGVPPSSGPRPVTPTHVYQAGPGSQMMMIPGQQLPFPSSPQGPAYFIPGQVGGTERPDLLLTYSSHFFFLSNNIVRLPTLPLLLS